ncbi:MAG: S1-like domain-containing RNA-binding protein [Lachnospiraceae bacterium]|nr:S1-like domain-containing RNA-binding protein [Lachnospiraceae bacterium]
MLKIGEKQILRIDRQVPFGVYLTGDVPNERVLLPRSQVPDGASIGDELEVFLYKDSEDRLIATRKEPKLTLHQVGYLTVIQVSRIGAFLDWGLDKDLLLPYHEQPRERVKEGQTVLVAVYLDKSERLCATMNVYPWLRTDSPYKTGDQVSGVVYETSRNFGAFVAVDSIYSALIPRRELVRELKAGEVVQARVTGIKPDGKIDLSIREKGYLQIDADVEAILNMLNEGGGMIPFTDKAAPELIREKTHMSKNEFKRAVGHLLKENKIFIEDDRIVLL